MSSKEKELIILCGKSSSGKDTILKELSNIYKPCISHTTRPMRPNEIEGKDYYFITNSIFKEMYKDGCFLENRKYYTIENGNKSIWNYGLNKNEILMSDSDKLISIIDMQGTLELVSNIKKYNIPIRTYVVYIKCNNELRKERAMKRPGYEEEEFVRRMHDDDMEFVNIENLANLVVENENVEIDEICSQILTAIETYKAYEE